MRLVYLTTLSYPSRFANRLQVMKMSEAFSRITDFTLFVSCVEENKEDVFVNYHVTHPIHIEQIGPTKRWPQSFWMARKLAKKIKSEPADTVFYVRELPLAFWLTLLSKKFRKAFFFEAQSLEKFHILFYNRVFPRARGIITSSRKKADLLQNMYGIPARKTTVFGNAVDLEEFQSASALESILKKNSVPRNKPIVMYAGSLQSDYGIHTMIAAAGILANEATFILIGRCDFDITLPNIVRIEQVPRHEIPRYLMDADILIAPYSDKNYFIKQYSVPIKISEYMAAGKPFIISDMPSIREVLNESLATFVKPDDPQDLAEKIRWVIAHPDEAAVKVKNAKEAVKKRTWNARAETIVDFISQNVMNTSQ